MRIKIDVKKLIGYEEGYKEGFEKGYKEGFEKGYKEGLIEAMLYMLTLRFNISRDVKENIQKELEKMDDMQRFQELKKVVLVASTLDEFFKHL